MIKEADALLADEIRTVKKLYDEGKLEKPEEWDFTPDLLQFYVANTPVEQELYLSFMEYRMRTFQGAFHINPDYSHWYGWAPLTSAKAKIDYEAGLMLSAGEIPAQAQKEKTTPGFEIWGVVTGIAMAVYLLRRR